ncbi:MAG: Gldg family protein [Alphaproteobacteria bacterium]
MSETQGTEGAAPEQKPRRTDRKGTSGKDGRIRLGWPRARYVAAFLTLAVVLFLALNVTSNSILRGARLDLTENRLFTLSEGTVNTLKKLKEPVVLRFFFSRHLASEAPQLRSYARKVEDLLREYSARAGDKLVLELIDPRAFSEEEDLAVSYGLQGAQTQSGEKFYFGLAGTNAIGETETIPFFTLERREYLEYDLTELVHNLNTLKKPVLGIVTNLPLDTGAGGLAMAMRGRSQSFLIYEQLRQRFRTQFLEQEFDRVPKNVDVLMIAHPRELDEGTLYAIDQFILRGGRALVFVDPYSEVSFKPGPGGMPVRGSTGSSKLEPLLEHWGVAYDPEAIVGDRGAAARVATSREAGAPTSRYVLWLALEEEQLSDKDPVTSELELINLSTPGYLEPLENGPLTFEPLITSTKDAKTFPRFDAQRNPAPEELLAAFVPEEREFVIAARLSGALKTAFPEGPPAEPEEADEGASKQEMKEKAEKLGVDVNEEEPLPPHVAQGTQPANIIVVADSDMFDDRFWVTERNVLGQRVGVPTADNAAFIVNAVENLMGSDELVSLRTRASDERTFEVVEDLRRAAEERYLAKEERLQSQLQEAEQRLKQLRGQGQGLEEGAGVQLSPEERRELARFTQEALRLRGELREVQRSLVADIESLGAVLAFLNIALVPLLVAGTAIALAVMRARKRARSV